MALWSGIVSGGNIGITSTAGDINGDNIRFVLGATVQTRLTARPMSFLAVVGDLPPLLI